MPCYLPMAMEAFSRLSPSGKRCFSTEMTIGYHSCELSAQCSGPLANIDTAVQIPHAHRVLCSKLVFIVDLIGKIFVAESVSSLDVLRFLGRLEDVVEDLLHAWQLVESAPSQILEQWLQIIRSERTHMSWRLPPTTPVFTCPFLLAGCRYQTVDFGEWAAHKDLCYKQHSGLIKSSFPTFLSSSSQELSNWDLTMDHISAELPAYLSAPGFLSDTSLFVNVRYSSYARPASGPSGSQPYSTPFFVEDRREQSALSLHLVTNFWPSSRLFAASFLPTGDLSAPRLSLVAGQALFLFGLSASVAIVAFFCNRRLMRKS